MDYREINNLLAKYIRERNNPNATVDDEDIEEYENYINSVENQDYIY